ncbi:MAG: hypothetical protein HKN58_01560 [Xanthomonadales bacterium]|nr:hypothetical protein [Xanthomonadales bacterium]
MLRTMQVAFLGVLSFTAVAVELPDKAVLKAESAANQQWMRQHYLQLLRSAPPTARASVLTSSVLFEEGVLLPEPEANFLALLKTEGLNSTALWNLAYVCRRPVYRESCADERVRERLIASDPDNAAVHLLPHFTNPQNADEKPKLSRQDVLNAAQAKRYDTYFARAAYQVFELALPAVESKPRPRSISVPDIEEPISWQAASIAMGAMYALPGFGNFFDICAHARRQDELELLAACEGLAALLKDHSRSLIAHNLGTALERQLVMQADPESEQALEMYRRQRLETRVLVCLSNWVWPSSIERVLAIDIGSMLKELGELGEFAFTERWADKNSTEHPDWADRTPDECRALRDLEGEAMIAELGDEDPYRLWLEEGDKIRSAVTAGN